MFFPVDATAINRVLHTEWRLIGFVLLFAAGCAFLTQNVAAAQYVAAGGLLTGLAAVVMRVQRRSLAVIALALLLAATAVMGRFQNSSLPPSTKGQFSSFQGIVEQLEYRAGKPARLTLRVTATTAGDLEGKKVRFSVRTKIDADTQVGDLVTFRGITGGLGGAIVPGGFDFSRHARFMGLAAQGFSVSAVTRLPVDTPATSSDFSLMLRGTRDQLAAQLLQHIDGQAGAVAVALTLGIRHHISDETAANLRRAGLSHLLAISGLHMGLVTACAFLFFELLFAGIPAIALRIMPKKAAVFPAFLIAFLYLLLSGASTASLRAFIMVSVAMLAILTDRKVVSLRSVALAAGFILVLAPEAVLSAGFQMSFAATAGLVGFYEQWQKRRVGTAQVQLSERPSGLIKKGGQYLGFIALTSLVAQVSVAPFALYHFQALSLVGLLANVAALPIITVVVMPLLFISLCLMGIGVLGLLAGPLSLALDSVLWIAGFVADLPFSTLRITQMSAVSFALCLSGFSLLLLVRSRASLVVAGIVLVGSVATAKQQQATVLISQSGTIIAQYRDGDMLISGGRQSSFRHKAWRQYWALDPKGNSGKLPKQCWQQSCRTKAEDGIFVSNVVSIAGVRDVCAAGDYVILPRRYKRFCQGARLVVTKEELLVKGPLGLLLKDGEPPVLLWSNPNAVVKRYKKNKPNKE